MIQPSPAQPQRCSTWMRIHPLARWRWRLLLMHALRCVSPALACVCVSVCAYAITNSATTAQPTLHLHAPARPDLAWGSHCLAQRLLRQAYQFRLGTKTNASNLSLAKIPLCSVNVVSWFQFCLSKTVVVRCHCAARQPPLFVPLLGCRHGVNRVGFHFRWCR